RDLAHRRREAVVDNDQVIVRVQREPVRVERSLRHGRGSEQLFGKSAARGQVRRPHRQATYEEAPGSPGWIDFHRTLLRVRSGWRFTTPLDHTSVSLDYSPRA